MRRNYEKGANASTSSSRKSVEGQRSPYRFYRAEYTLRRRGSPPLCVCVWGGGEVASSIFSKLMPDCHKVASELRQGGAVCKHASGLISSS